MPRTKKERVVSAESSEVDTSEPESTASDDARSEASSSDVSSSDDASDEEPPTKKKHKKKVAKKRDQEKKPKKTEKKRHKEEPTASKQTKTNKHDKKRVKKADTASSASSETSVEDADHMTANLLQQYRDKMRKFVKKDNMFGFMKILTESPLATVLESLHFLFVSASNNADMIDKLHSINGDFNIVSKKFINAVHTLDDCRHKYAESEKVAEKICDNTPLKQIEGISNYTPEFIIMKTIQAGDLVACNMMLQKWDVVPMFAASKHLIAAFYGWEDFFCKTERYSKSQDLIVHALAGGYKRTLEKVCTGSGSRWILPDTLQKAGLVCPVNSDLKTRFNKLLKDRL